MLKSCKCINLARKAFGMVDRRTASTFSECNNPEAGCFASDPGAFEAMLFMDDSIVRSNYQRIAAAADKAGHNGTPLDEATYRPATFETIGSFRSSESIDGFGVMGNIGSGETQSVGDLLIADNSTEARIAKCAYVCGRIGVGNCPIKTPQD